MQFIFIFNMCVCVLPGFRRPTVCVCACEYVWVFIDSQWVEHSSWPCFLLLLLVHRQRVRPEAAGTRHCLEELPGTVALQPLDLSWPGCMFWPDVMFLDREGGETRTWAGHPVCHQHVNRWNPSIWNDWNILCYYGSRGSVPPVSHAANKKCYNAQC